MTPDTPGRPPRPTHEEILENEQTKGNHVINVLLICQNIMEIMYEGIKSGLFQRSDDDVIAFANTIVTESQNALCSDDRGEYKG